MLIVSLTCLLSSSRPPTGDADAHLAKETSPGTTEENPPEPGIAIVAAVDEGYPSVMVHENGERLIVMACLYSAGAPPAHYPAASPIIR